MAQARRPDDLTPDRMSTNDSKLNRSKGYVGPSNLNPARKRMDPERLSQDSQLPKMTQDLAHDIGSESRIHPHLTTKDKENDPTPRAPKRGIFASAPAASHQKRPPFSDILNSGYVEAKRKANGRVHLPDVTGVTSAIQSPMKDGEEYMQPDGQFPSLQSFTYI
jgi:hypothetical protein